ncbi:putative inorganic carbon transporter subunit DabA [Tundrisphaera lichenicola]|uniref:putative inorganic carbon transporter subunit DabA n=1 Tax=Tundrisphaera lichenicola TaxID=2029860 RepID=UPI003EBEDB7D
MLEITEIEEVEVGAGTLMDEAARACDRIPPLWDLPNYVAVNPYLGFSAWPIAEAFRTVGDGLGARVLPGAEYYRARWREGAFGPSDLGEAARRARVAASSLEDILEGRVEMARRESYPALTFAERHDRRHGTDWHDQILRSVARWCAVHASGGGPSWKRPDDGRGLYASWLESARVDRSFEIAGLQGWREWARRLPDQPDRAIAAMLAGLEVAPAVRLPYFYRLLGGLYGWSSYFRRESWQAGGDDPGSLLDLLAIRLCTDAAVAFLAPSPADSRPVPSPDRVEDESIRLVFQEAMEDSYARGILRKLAAPDRSIDANRPEIQAVFCIDVRSEPFRRHLEARSAGIETLGFAGFFGVSLDWRVDTGESARCPVLLKPSLALGPAARSTSGTFKLGAVVKSLLVAPAASFSFVETLGLAYGIGLAGDALAARPSGDRSEHAARFGLDRDGSGRGIEAESRLELAAGILKNMGLRDRFARLVLLCGHEGRSANNPHKAGLDCGACGGHGGAINARVAAAILNDPTVRAGLSSRGYGVPEDTWFLAGVHDTSADEVSLLDLDRVPASHASDVAMLRDHLAKAGALVREERARSLGLAGRPARGLLARLRRRARDWSEVRPEWALARNAVFLVARRQRTRGVDLQGRTFLHEYDATTDLDGSVLGLILSAPMVVASWINLQYFASTVDNRVFGSGNKTLHNRVGTLGVVLGNGGDLRTGLPLQSVHDPDGRWFHEPLRLQVIVEAPKGRIEAILADREGVRDLVESGWVRLFALDPEGSGTDLWTPGAGWEPVRDIDPDRQPADRLD